MKAWMQRRFWMRDLRSLAGIVIDTVHARVHKGQVFSVLADVAALGDAGDLDLLVQAGGRAPHLRMHVAIGGDAELTLYENADATPGSNQIVATNHNRFSTTNAAAKFYRDPTVNDPGAILEGPLYVPGGTGGRALGGRANFRDEWILATDTDYLLRLTNVSGQARRAQVHVLFYEPTE